jgi:hypothetical protein
MAGDKIDGCLDEWRVRRHVSGEMDGRLFTF